MFRDGVDGNAFGKTPQIRLLLIIIEMTHALLGLKLLETKILRAHQNGLQIQIRPSLRDLVWRLLIGQI
jgi:hypothetical protein